MRPTAAAAEPASGVVATGWLQPFTLIRRLSVVANASRLPFFSFPLSRSGSKTSSELLLLLLLLNRL